MVLFSVFVDPDSCCGVIPQRVNSPKVNFGIVDFLLTKL